MADVTIQTARDGRSQAERGAMTEEELDEELDARALIRVVRELQSLAERLLSRTQIPDPYAWRSVAEMMGR